MNKTVEVPTKKKLEILRRQLNENASYRTGTLRVHRPWIFVSFETHYTFDGMSTHVELWGVAKICWPDKWNIDKGVDLAIRRALAWGAKKALADINGAPTYTSESIIDYFESRSTVNPEYMEHLMSEARNDE